MASPVPDQRSARRRPWHPSFPAIAGLCLAVWILSGVSATSFSPSRSASAQPPKASSNAEDKDKNKVNAEDKDNAEDAASEPEKAPAKAKTKKAAKPTDGAGGSSGVDMKTVARLDYIDELIEVAWEDGKVKPSETASDAEFLRRAYLDLLGRTPSIAEARGFLSSKESGKRTKLINTLLAHPDYPKNFAGIWQIILIGRGNNGNAQQDVNYPALTTWMRRQFADNRPWNEIAHEIINARGSNKDNGAANFILAHVGDKAVNLTSNTTRIFLGQQIQCTECHDHPSNDWKQADFWGVNAFFKGVRSERVMTTNRTGAQVVDYVKVFDEPTDAYSSYDRRNGLVGIAFPTFLDGKKIPQGTDADRRAELARLITGPENTAFAQAFVNRMWAHLLGRGFVHTVDDFGDHNPPSHPELLEQLALDFQASGYDVKQLIRWITASRAYHLSSRLNEQNKLDEVLFSHMTLKPMTPEQLYESLLVATGVAKLGDADQERTKFARQFVTTFGNDDGAETISFQGTIPQALMMMNGELMSKATSGKSGSLLAKLWDEAKLSKQPEAYLISHIYIAALSRFPTDTEVKTASAFFRADPMRRPDLVAQDLFWALLNSNEFVLNH